MSFLSFYFAFAIIPSILARPLFFHVIKMTNNLATGNQWVDHILIWHEDRKKVYLEHNLIEFLFPPVGCSIAIFLECLYLFPIKSMMSIEQTIGNVRDRDKINSTKSK